MDVKKEQHCQSWATRYRSSLFTVQKHNFITLFSDLGETGSSFMQEIFPVSTLCCPEATVQIDLLAVTVTANKRYDVWQLLDAHTDTGAVSSVLSSFFVDTYH